MYAYIGKCDVLDGGMKVLKKLGAGDYFGEVALLATNKRIANVKAITYVNCEYLTVSHNWIGLVNDAIRSFEIDKEALLDQR